MNALVAALVGSMVGLVAMIGGVSAIQSAGESEAVSPASLYTYADE